eukprot:gene7968-8826_t
MFSLKRGTSCLMIIIVLICIGCADSTNNTTAQPNTTTPTNSAPPPPLTHFEKFIAVFCILVMVAGFVGNFLVILIFTMRCSRLKVCEVFMVSLAFADLIGTFTVPLQLLRTALRVPDTVNGVFIACELPSWLGVTCISVSAITLVAIAIDRFIIVYWPLKIRYENNLALGMIVASTWIVGGTFGFVHFFRTDQTYHEPTASYHCSNNLSEDENRSLTIALFIFQMFIPVTLMTALYSIIAYKLRSGSVSARRLSETDNVTRIRTRRQKKATKLFVTVVFTFYILVLPSNIFQLVLSFEHFGHTEGTFFVYQVVSLLLLSNSCVNPIIYSRLHKSFRKSTLSLLFGSCFPKYWRYEWNSKFISRSSYLRRRRSTAYTNSQYLQTVRGSPSPCPEGRGATPSPRPSVAGVNCSSARSSRHTSTASITSGDDVFYHHKTSSLRVGYCKEDENVKMPLDKIPEQNGTHANEKSNDECGGDKDSPPPVAHIGKYMPFTNTSLDGNGVANGRHVSNESSNTTTTVDTEDRHSPVASSQTACVNERFTPEEPSHPEQYRILKQTSSTIDPDDFQL